MDQSGIEVGAVGVDGAGSTAVHPSVLLAKPELVAERGGRNVEASGGDEEMRVRVPFDPHFRKSTARRAGYFPADMSDRRATPDNCRIGGVDHDAR